MLRLVTERTPSVAIEGIVYYRLGAYLLSDNGDQVRCTKPKNLASIWEGLVQEERDFRYEFMEKDFVLQNS